MSIQEKLIHAIERTDYFYLAIFKYIFEVTDQATYDRIYQYEQQLNEANISGLIKQSLFDNNIDKMFLYKQVQVIQDKYKSDEQKLNNYYNEIRVKADKSVPWKDLFIYQNTLGHFEEFESSIALLKENISPNPSPSVKSKIISVSNNNLECNLTEVQMEKLCNALIESGYISSLTKLSDFKNLFNTKNERNNDEINPVSWVLKNPKNNDISIKGLVDFFLLLQDRQFVNFNNDQTLYRFINKYFVDENFHSIKSSSANKPQWVKSDFASEHANFINIIDSL